MIKQVFGVLFHPVTLINVMLVGSLGFIQAIHTKAHHDLGVDVHGHVKRYLNKHPETCKYIEY